MPLLEAGSLCGVSEKYFLRGMDTDFADNTLRDKLSPEFVCRCILIVESVSRLTRLKKNISSALGVPPYSCSRISTKHFPPYTA
jgi:hypothetical protein